MKPSEIANQFFQAVEMNDFNKAGNLLSDDFTLEGITPTPLNKQEFLNVHSALNSGLPDFRFNHRIVKETANEVEVSVRLTGTHTKDMQPPIPGMELIRATNRIITMPEEKIRLLIKNNRVAKTFVEPVQNGGLPGLLKQIGVDIHEVVH